MFSQMTIGRKLILGFAGLLTLLVGLSFTFLNVVGTLKDTFDTAVDKTSRKIALAGDFDSAQAAMMIGQRGVMLSAFAKKQCPVRHQ